MEDMIKCTLAVDLNTCPFHKVALMDGEEKIICENPDFKSCGYYERPPEKHVYERKERWYEINFYSEKEGEIFGYRYCYGICYCNVI